MHGPWPMLPDIETLLKTIRSETFRISCLSTTRNSIYVRRSVSKWRLLSDLLVFPARIWIAFDVTSNLPEMLKDRSGSCKIVPIVMDELVSSVECRQTRVRSRRGDCAAAAIVSVAACYPFAWSKPAALAP